MSEIKGPVERVSPEEVVKAMGEMKAGKRRVGKGRVGRSGLV